MTKTKIGSFECITPLGENLLENWKAIRNKETALKKESVKDDLDVYISRFDSAAKFGEIIVQAVDQLAQKTDLRQTKKTKIILSTTKGSVKDWSDYANHRLYNIEKDIKKVLPSIKDSSITVSNACVSGLQAVEIAQNGIENDLWDTAIVVAFDEVSQFVLEGFNSFLALSAGICRPYDRDRDGINLGSAVAVAAVSKHDIFLDQPYQISAAFTFNDANHISGPSRNGEGLYRAISQTLKYSGVQPDFISLHGTGTPYNDEMESIALDRIDLTDTPVHSLKPYFGHTLGAAGLLELAIVSKMIETQEAIASPGFKNQGTSIPLKVQKTVTKTPMKQIMKTMSGFGGNNTALILQADE